MEHLLDQILAYLIKNHLLDSYYQTQLNSHFELKQNSNNINNFFPVILLRLKFLFRQFKNPNCLFFVFLFGYQIWIYLEMSFQGFHLIGIMVRQNVCSENSKIGFWHVEISKEIFESKNAQENPILLLSITINLGLAWPSSKMITFLYSFATKNGNPPTKITGNYW